MKDSRLRQTTALLDDARSILVELVDQAPIGDATVKDFNHVDAARQFINSAIVHIQLADSEHTPPDQPA